MRYIYLFTLSVCFCCPLFLFSLGGLLDTIGVVKDGHKVTIAIDNCIVPFPGVKVPCDMPVDADGKISITDLKCVDDPKKPYCVKCVEIVPDSKGQKNCKVYNIDGTEMGHN